MVDPSSRSRRRAILALGAAASLPATAFARPRFVNVLTGSPSGVYYPLGIALSGIYAQAIPEARASAQATKGSVENLALLEADRGEVAFSLGDALSDAYRGRAEAGFKSPLTRLRTMAAIYPNTIQIVASAESGIRTLADLKGRRISVGASKSGTELNARAVLAAAGLSYGDFARVDYLGFGESVERMKNFQLDAMLQSAGLGVASIRDLAASMAIVLIAVPPEVVARIGDAAYRPALVPADTYAGQKAPVATIEIENYLVTHDRVPDDLVHAMTRATFEHLDVLVASHVAARAITPANATRHPPVPLHPGAARWYREAGVLA